MKDPPSISTEKKYLNSTIESGHENPKRGPCQMVKDNPFSNKSNDSKFSCYLESSMVDYANKHMKNFISNQVLQNEITSFNLVSGNVLNAKTLDPYLRELLTEH